MPRKIPEEVIALVRELDQKGISMRMIAQRTGVSYSTVWVYTKTNFESYNAYQEHRAKARGESLEKYKKQLAEERRKRPKNQRLGDLVKKRLKELKKSQAWLGEQLGITKQAVNLYIQGTNFPKDKILSKLYSALEVPYETLDDLLKQINP